MIWIVVAATIAAAIFGIHRLALLAEERGWIYYKNPRGSIGAYGAAFIQATSMFAPEVEHAIEEQQAEEQRADVTESGSDFDEEDTFPGGIESN